MTYEDPIKLLLVSFPAQGHINHLVGLGKYLAAKGATVIFTTTETAGKNMRVANNIIDKFATPIGDGTFAFEFFDDGLPDGDGSAFRALQHYAELEVAGRHSISQMIKNHADSNKPFSCIINNYFFPWVCDVANEHNIPSVLSWTNSAAVFTTYYNYVHKLTPFPTNEEPYIDVQLTSSTVLKYNEISDLVHPFCPFPFLGKLVLEEFKDLSKVFCVLVDTYEELEHEFIDYISKKSIPIRTVGPSFKDPNVKGASNIHGDFAKSNDDDKIIEWLDTKPKGSVVYVSFGTLVNYPQEQMNEIVYGLLNSQVSFLWSLSNPGVLPDGFLEETNERGKVVKWSPQVEVLAHPSVACFITHCGWNSSMEALSLGVPVLTFPSRGDQLTNAKFLVDVFGVGIKMGSGWVVNNKLVTRDEVKKCLLEATIGEKAERLKQNANKWKKKAEEALAVGGSSDRNLDEFMEDIKKHALLINNVNI